MASGNQFRPEILRYTTRRLFGLCGKPHRPLFSGWRPSMKLPPLDHPERYVGLYVYDFGSHASVGYTATEVRVLRAHDTHGQGVAYEICRVDERGSLMLKGVLDERLSAQEAMCFCRTNESAARTDYEALIVAADNRPAPCGAEVCLTTTNEADLPHAASLVYPAWASGLMGRWLQAIAFAGGDRVIGGIDAYTAVLGSGPEPIASQKLKAASDRVDRSREDVLRTVDRPVQRFFDG